MSTPSNHGGQQPAPTFPKPRIEEWMRKAAHEIAIKVGLPPNRDLSVDWAAEIISEVYAEEQQAKAKSPQRTHEKLNQAALERIRVRSAGAEQELREAEGGCLSEREFGRALGIQSDAVLRAHLRTGRLFVWDAQTNSPLYPKWQIHGGDILPGLADVLTILRAKTTETASHAAYFLTASDDLDGARPLDFLRQNRVDEVKAHASRYGDIGM